MTKATDITERLRNELEETRILDRKGRWIHNPAADAMVGHGPYRAEDDGGEE